MGEQLKIKTYIQYNSLKELILPAHMEADFTSDKHTYS